MKTEYITHTQEISVAELNQMIEDMEIIIYQVEKMSEVLAEKMLNRHPVFCSLIRALLISNCHAVKATLQIKGLLDKTLDDYLAKSETNIVE